MITLAAIAAQSAAVATKSAAVVHGFGLIPPIGTKGFESFPLMIGAALFLLFYVTVMWSPRVPNGSEAAQKRRDW